MLDIFEKIRITAEDAVKTRQYAENGLRERAREGVSYDEFIASLDLKADRVETRDSLERIVQMLGKTNQFNLTTKRYGRQEILAMLQGHYKFFAWKVRDRFGDYGIVALVIVDMMIPKIDTFLMSCRVMGKQLENFFINEVEEELLREGICELLAEYIPSPKNLPVANLYPNLGYEAVDSATKTGVLYKIELRNRPARHFYVNQRREL